MTQEDYNKLVDEVAHAISVTPKNEVYSGAKIVVYLVERAYRKNLRLGKHGTTLKNPAQVNRV